MSWKAVTIAAGRMRVAAIWYRRIVDRRLKKGGTFEVKAVICLVMVCGFEV